MELGFDLASNRGAVLDNLRAGSREEAAQLLGFRGDIDASQASVSQVTSQPLRVAAIRFDLIVRRHGNGRRIDNDVGDPHLGECSILKDARKLCRSLILLKKQLSLSRLNHRLPWAQTHPEV